MAQVRPSLTESAVWGVRGSVLQYRPCRDSRPRVPLVPMPSVLLQPYLALLHQHAGVRTSVANYQPRPGSSRGRADVERRWQGRPDPAPKLRRRLPGTGFSA